MTSSEPRKKVISISYPKWAGEEYLKDFESKYELHHVVPRDRKGTVAAFHEKVKSEGPFDAVAILMGTGPYEPFDEELLAPLTPHCKLMVSASAGYNEFDVDWMTKNGMVFCNSRNAVSESTADMSIWLMIGVLRNCHALIKSMNRGMWRSNLAPTRDPTGMTLGIIGLGAIGKIVAAKAKVFNMNIKYHQRTRMSIADETKFEAEYCPTLDDLLKVSEVIMVCAPLNNQTRGMIGKEQFQKMKDGVFIVNTARGAIIDEAALIEALENGKVARAGLDVFENEPKINHYFLDNEKVLIQPHMGGITEVAWKKAYRECIENIKSFFETGKAISPVNAEEVAALQKTN